MRRQFFLAAIILCLILAMLPGATGVGAQDDLLKAEIT